ncbi:MAG: L-2-amino-thiazoline-4-carboxylic acid hydrolase [Candidatus Hodarchaeota archaeon]
MQQAAQISQQRQYSGNMVLEYVAGDGETFEWGVNIQECAVLKLCQCLGLEELVPYICLCDYALYRGIGIGFKRTKTLGMGFDICDYRIVKGYKTPRGWPPENVNDFRNYLNRQRQ